MQLAENESPGTNTTTTNPKAAQTLNAPFGQSVVCIWS